MSTRGIIATQQNADDAHVARNPTIEVERVDAVARAPVEPDETPSDVAEDDDGP